MFKKSFLFLSIIMANILFADSFQNINQLIKELQKIKSVLQQKQKKESLSESQILSKKIDLLNIKIRFLKEYRNYLELKTLNKSKLIDLLKRMDNDSINFYQNAFLFIHYNGKVKINNKIYYQINSNILNNILQQVFYIKSKIKALRFEEKTLKSLPMDKLQSLFLLKFNDLGNPVIFLANNTNPSGYTSPNSYTYSYMSNFANDNNSYILKDKLPFREIKEISNNILYLQGIK